MSSDKKTIGVAPRNIRALAALMSTGHFATESDAAKYAFAVAARRDTPPGALEGAETKWNVGSFDNDQTLRLVVEAIYGDVQEPYRLVEFLINAGLEAIEPSGDVPPDLFAELFHSTPKSA